MQVLGSPAVILAAALLLAPPVSGQSLDEVARDLLHSDLPIFGHGGDNEWPQHFYDEDSFGCTSPVVFGDWALREASAEAEGDVQWYRFSNYGVFHCWANTFRAHERARLDGADSHPSFFVFLGKTSVDQSDIELWTIQIGARPGSEYLLLSRAPGEGLIERFTVLQTACPRANVRDAGSLDILLTRYCAVNSRSELIRLARRMAERPPLGTLTRVPAEDEIEEETHEPVLPLLMQGAPVAGQASPLGECAQSLVSQYHESFGPEDANAHAALFKDNAIWFNAFGAQGLGREGVREIWEHLLSSGTFSTAQRQVLGTSMHELSGGSMLVDQVQRISGQRTPGEPGRELPDRFVHLTFIVEKAAEGCLFAYYRAGDLRALPQWTPPVAVRIETLREYVGHYVSELRGDTVEVRLENEKLRLVILEDGDVLEMEPVSESEFRVHNNLDTFEFVRDQRGTVAYLLIRGASLDRLTRISK